MMHTQDNRNGRGLAGTADDGLADENAKLKKINQVLMTRVERSMDMQGSDFTLFEHAILLESKVRERTEELERALADLRKSHQELAGAKAEAERANSSKTRFLAAASHDLLQPLNAARLFVAALGETDQNERNRSLIGNIDTAFAAVEDLLSDLLEISKLDAGVQRVDLVDLPLSPLLTSLTAEFRPFAEEKTLDFACGSTDVVLHTDRQLIGRVLRNLIGNAIRYTKSGGVEIRTEIIDGRCRIDVVDSGCGIPEDQQLLVFEEFKRLDRDDAVSDRGFGLGLAIVQRIARLLGHPIELSSRPGEGSRFSISIPIAKPAHPPVSISHPPDRAAEGAEAAGTLLVIDNEEAIRAGMTALLEGWGYRVVTASTAETGLDALDSLGLTPDLLIADYHLDHAAFGTEVIAAIRSVKGATLPAMIITADRSEEVRDEVAGKDLILLTKPVKPAKLRALIRHLLGG